MADTPDTPDIEVISAVTLVTADMAASTAFYRALGFRERDGRTTPEFTSLEAGPGYVNLQLDPDWVPPRVVWGRVILWVDDVDAMHQCALVAGYRPSTEPADAPWGERFFHILDPAGHELSFASPLD